MKKTINMTRHSTWKKAVYQQGKNDNSLLASYTKLSKSASSAAFQRANIIIFHALQHFSKTRQIHAKRHQSITTTSFEPVRKMFNTKRATWELSIVLLACRLKPSSLHSKLASVTSSLIAKRGKKKDASKWVKDRCWIRVFFTIQELVKSSSFC